MENQLIIIKKQILSLKEMSLRRVVMNIWNGSDILATIAEFTMEALSDEKHEVHFVQGMYEREVEDKVKDEILKLQLPVTLLKQLIVLVKPIGLEIRRWKIFHQNYLSNFGIDGYLILDVPILKLLVWTTAAAIDYRKTAEELIRLEKLDVMKRYKLACLYCLEKNVPHLWKELPEMSRQHYSGEPTFEIKCFELEYWAYVLAGEESKLNDFFGRKFGDEFSFYQHAFKCSAVKGNRAASEYFFHKLTKEERDTFLLGTASAAIQEMCREPPYWEYCFPEGKHADVLCHLLTLMSPKQQKQILKEAACDILTCFLDWPWQDIFLDIAAVIWSFIPKFMYFRIRINILENYSRTSCSFPKFFMISPKSFKNFFVDLEYNISALFSEFFRVEDTESIEVVFRCVDAEDRMILVSSNSFFQLFDRFLMRDKWHLVELCIREATLSKEDRLTLKGTFKRNLAKTKKQDIELRNIKWKRIFEFLDKTDLNASNDTSSEDVTADHSCAVKSKRMVCQETGK